MRLLALALILLAGRGFCDVVVLNSGMMIRGKILAETETSVVVEGCASPILKSEIKQVLRNYRDGVDEYRERAAALADDDVQGRLDLIRFCLDNGLFPEARLETARLPRTPEMEVEREAFAKRASAIEALAESKGALERGDYERAVTLAEQARDSNVLTQAQAEEIAAVLAGAQEALAQRQRLAEFAALAAAPAEQKAPYGLYVFPGGRGVEELVRLVSGAEQKVFFASSALDLGVLIDTLRRVAGRGVAVTLLSGDFSPSCESLRDVGVTLLSPKGRGRMRHNFVLVDGRVIWFGTFEPTELAAFNSRAIAISTDAPEIVEDFAVEAEELIAGQFGRESKPGLPSARFMLGGENGALYMLPEDDGFAAVEALCRTAIQSIRVSIADPLDKRLVKVLREAAGNGVKVLVVADESLRERWRTLRRLPRYGLETRIETERQKLSGGYIVIDGGVAIVSSSGFDSPSFKDDDGWLLLLSSEKLKTLLVNEFSVLFRTGVAP